MSVKWFYENDTNKWCPFEGALGEAVEEAHSEHGTICFPFEDLFFEFDFAKMTQTNLATGKVRRIQREADTRGLFRNLELAIQAIHEKIVLHKKRKEQLNDNLTQYSLNPEKTGHAYKQLESEIEALMKEHNEFVDASEHYKDLLGNYPYMFRACNHLFQQPPIRSDQNIDSTDVGAFRQWTLGHGYLFHFPPDKTREFINLETATCKSTGDSTCESATWVSYFIILEHRYCGCVALEWWVVFCKQG